MGGTELVSAIINILVSGITGVASGVGQGLSTLAQNIFFTTTTGDNPTTTLSVLGICIVSFAAISLALSLCRFERNWSTLNRYKNLERFNTNQNGSYYLKNFNTCNA